ncbi:hypothetical protein CY35_10G050500 [Sphagnum magellanicum]|nr:hypothetical protein CY35_10G050500 [Sphagnum magellanicum]
MVAVAAATAMSTIAATTTTTKAVTAMLSTKSLLSSFSSCSCSCSCSGSSIPGLSSRCSRSAGSALVGRNNNSSRQFLLVGLSSGGATICGGRGALRLTFPSKNNGGGGSSGVRNGSGVKKISAIAVGEKLPEAELSYLDKEDNVQTVKISELARGKKLVLFAVPGAFTPTCSQKHLPGFVEKSGELRDSGVDTIACVSVNDAFVMKAWGEKVGVGDKVLLLSDGLGKFTKALGAILDLSDKAVGLGIRSRRYALLAEDGVVTSLNMEEGGAFTISGPDEILKALKAVVYNEDT